MNESGLVRLLEAVHALERDDRTWLAGVLSAMRNLSDYEVCPESSGVAIARQRIRAAASSLDSLRTQRRREGRGALDAWHPSTNGRWTLVDEFEEGGRRYIVARENEVQACGVERLTNRERQVVLHAALGFTNKEIAHALGISDTTVRVLMSRAAVRLGVRSRDELLALPEVQQMRSSDQS
jgi:DNA-binding NarL/FixJ family response regulator